MKKERNRKIQRVELRVERARQTGRCYDDNIIILPATDPRVVKAIDNTMERFKGAWIALADR